MLFYHTRLYFRDLFKPRIEILINILGLAVGFSSLMLLSLYILNEYRTGRDYEGYKNVYRLEARDGVWFSKKIIDLFRDNIPEIDAMTYVQESWSLMRYIKINDVTFNADRLIYADSTFFKIFSYKSVLGDLNTALTHDNAIVLTQHLAEKLFPGENPIGKTIRFQTTAFGEFDLTIEAVTENMRSNALLNFNGVISINLLNQVSWYKKDTKHWGSSNYESYIKISDPLKALKVTKKMEELLKTETPEWVSKDNLPLKLKSYKKLYFDLSSTDDLLKHNKLQNINLLMLISALLFILVIFNYINLNTADFERKTKTFQIVRVFGNLRGYIFRKGYVESFFTISLSFFFSIVLIDNLLPNFNRFTDEHFNVQCLFTDNFYLPLILIIAFTVCGIVPALFLLKLLKGYSVTGHFIRISERGSLRNSIVLIQYIIALIFLISTLVIIRQNQLLASKPPGFMKENIIYIPLISAFDGKTTKVFENELLKVPQIKNITYTSSILGQLDTEWGVEMLNEGERKRISFSILQVDTTFFNFFGIDILKGRNFNSQSLKEMHHIFNETAVRDFGINNINHARIVSFENTSGDIIGVAEDFNFKSLHLPVTPLGFIYRKPENLSYVYIQIPDMSPDQLKSLIMKLEGIWKKLAPDWPFGFGFLDNTYEQLYKKDKDFGKITGWATIFTVLIASFGLFGVTIFTAQRRIKETGIRKVNGAKTPEILFLFLKDFAIWVVFAFVLACPVTWIIMNNWLQNFAYRTNLSWWIFAAAGMVVLLVALLTVSWQSWRAASRNPVEALRYE